LCLGCFCVYHSESTLEYVRRSLEKTLLSDLQRDDRQPFQGLPIVLVLGHNADVTEKGLAQLREEGQALADR
jgi:p190RhoGAP, pG1 and pG2 domains